MPACNIVRRPRREPKLRLQRPLLAVCAALAMSVAAAQDAAQPSAAAARGAGGPAPRLGAPLGGERIVDAQHNVVFTWSAPPAAPGVPPPERYRLCIAPQGAGCAAPSAVVYDAGKATRFQAAVPPALRGQLLAWSVAACGPGYGAGSSGRDRDCSWANPRALDARE